MKVFLLFLLLCVSSPKLFSQLWADYLSPFDTTITSNEELTIYGRIKISEIPAQYGTDTNYTGKILINVKGQDARFSQLFSFDAVYDRYFDNAKQYKATITNIPPGNYWFCYGYYLNNELKWAGGGAFNDGFMHFGILTVTLATNIEQNQIPIINKLYQNYPNPFNPTTKINYSIPRRSLVTLKVYNILGNEVATLVNEEKAAGNYKVVFDGSYLSSGTFFYKIQSGSFTDTKKFILLK